MHLINSIKELLGPDTAIICMMSGNFVQRGEFACFEKHARANAAIKCGADLVLELPFPRSISSAERFASGAVEALDAVGICTHLVFGSECGDISRLERAAAALCADETQAKIKLMAKGGMSYAFARQAVMTEQLGYDGNILSQANNTLGVEYLKALIQHNSAMTPITIQRRGDGHDSEGCSGMSLRKALFEGRNPWEHIPEQAANIFKNEIQLGRGPVDTGSAENAILAVLRRHTDFSRLPDASEGLDRRLEKYCASEPTLEKVLEKSKTRRYAMSRLRRMVLCAYLGVSDADVTAPVSYISVLAMNSKGKRLLKLMSEKSRIPTITKPASAKRMCPEIRSLFELQARATDLYTLAYPSAGQRFGGQEWTTGPVITE